MKTIPLITAAIAFAVGAAALQTVPADAGSGFGARAASNSPMQAAPQRTCITVQKKVKVKYWCKKGYHHTWCYDFVLKPVTNCP